MRMWWSRWNEPCARRRRAMPAVESVAGEMLCAAVPSRRSTRSTKSLSSPPPAVGQVPAPGVSTPKARGSSIRGSSVPAGLQYNRTCVVRQLNKS